MDDKVKFFIVMALAGPSLILMTLTTKGVVPSIGIIVAVAVMIGAVALGVLVFKQRKNILFARSVKDKPKVVVDEATRTLCGFKKFVAYKDYVIFESQSGKLTGHAYIQLENIPYGIEQMDKETQFNITSSFSRLLGTFNHPFTYMPICRPVNRKKFMDGIQKKIHNIRITNAVSKVPDPKHEIEEKRLLELLKRLTEGENPMELLWIVQIRESRSTVPEIKAKLDSYTESMIDSLSVIHSVSARRLTHADMVEAVRNYFILED